jgi:outer membrane autotransporter protein
MRGDFAKGNAGRTIGPSQVQAGARSELGFRTDRSFVLQGAILTLRGRAAWAHNFDTDRSISPTFQTLPALSFVVNGAAQARDAALTTVSAEMKWTNNWSVAGTFEGEFSGITASYAGKGVVRYSGDEPGVRRSHRQSSERFGTAYRERQSHERTRAPTSGS